MDAIITERLELLPITRLLVEVVIAGEREEAERIVGAKFPDLWPGRALVERAFSCPLEKLRLDPEAWLWGARVLVTREGHADGHRRVVGSVVLNGRPGTDGTVEIAYGVDDIWQGLGFATEGTRAVVGWALDQRRVGNASRLSSASSSLWLLADRISRARIALGVEVNGVGSLAGRGWAMGAAARRPKRWITRRRAVERASAAARRESSGRRGSR